ncbi:hypothetical protein QDY65_04255 [Pyrococcus kukulkanii]|uniref:hypothetical protein n=1 Tax=Pyrococcus kukulkanii TaxID=1609559 RepID=UPI0035669706
MNSDIAIVLFNILLLGIVGAIHWSSAKYGTEYSKLPGFSRKVNTLLFIWLLVTDLAYCLRSKIFALLSSTFWIVLMVFVLRDQDVLYNRFEVDSKRPCKSITVRALLGRESYPCLIELARRTSVDFAITVWFLLTVAILVPIFSILFYAFFWEEGVIYFVSFMEILGYSLTITVLTLLPLAYLMRRNLQKIRIKELLESQLR